LNGRELTIFLSFPQSERFLEIALYDILGRQYEIYSFSAPNVNELSLKLPGVASGKYWLKIIGRNINYVAPIIIQK
jgi:hypothetical protein